MIKLYDKTGNTIIANLENCIECFVEEERNGIFELKLIYPTFDSNFNSLIKENIIVSNANDILKNQKFRIYHISKEIANKVQIYARHISFDLMYDFIESINIENQSCEYALNTIFRNSQFCRHYRGYSNIINAQNFKIEMIDCLSAIAGSKGSIIDTFGIGAEILRDNENIHVLNRRGHDNNVTIEYGKNLTGFNCTEDTTDLITRIFPYAKCTPEGQEETIVKGIYIDSNFINNFSHPYIKHIDFSDKFEDNEVPTLEKLRTLSEKYFKENKCDIPKLNYKIEFVPLSKCVGYENLEDKISLCDVVTVKHRIYKIDTQVKVIKTVFNVLEGRYESMELGEPKTNIGDIIGNGQNGQDGKPGPPGPQGVQGPPGEDGNIGDFPDTLPSIPNLTSKVYGFSNIELSWTFENKLYYSYELYASKVKDFTPNVFDLIFQGQASTFLFQAKPNETWYFRCCAINSHGNRTLFSNQITVTTTKIDDLSNYVGEMAIGEALIGTLSLDRGWVGELRGDYIDAKQLSVTDGNGKRTLDIDSFGNVNLDVTKLKIASKDVATREENETYTNTQIELVNNEIALKASKTELDNLDKRVEDAEIKLTPSKIINTVNEQLKAGGTIKGVATIIDKDKFLVKDSSGGSIAMDNGTIVMKNGNEKKMIALEDRQLKLYNREGTNREEGNISSILSKDGTGGIGVYARNHTGSKVDLGIDNYDGSITLLFRGVKGRIDLWQRTVANKEIYCHEDIYAKNFIKTVAKIPSGFEKYAINTNGDNGIDLYECILELKSEVTKLKEEIKMLKNK